MTDTDPTLGLIADAFPTGLIDTINEARAALEKIDAALFSKVAPETARILEACNAADHALFRLLAVTHNYGKVPMSDGQLFNLDRAGSPE